jgi:hypothetical protein
LADVERETSRAIPEVDALLLESRVHGKQHNYVQARVAYERANQLRISVNQQRLLAVDAAFKKNERRLKEKMARDLEMVDEREKARIADLEFKHSSEQAIVTNKLRVQDMKADRALLEAARSERGESSPVTVRSSPPSPRRSRSVVGRSTDEVLPKRSWQLAMDSP